MKLTSIDVHLDLSDEEPRAQYGPDHGYREAGQMVQPTDAIVTFFVGPEPAVVQAHGKALTKDGRIDKRHSYKLFIFGHYQWKSWLVENALAELVGYKEPV